MSFDGADGGGDEGVDVGAESDAGVVVSVVDAALEDGFCVLPEGLEPFVDFL